MSLNARDTDIETSHEAAARLSDKDRQIVYAEFKLGRPLADFQLEDRLGGHMNGRWRKRRSDLTRDGLLKPILGEDGNILKILNPYYRAHGGGLGA